jgi:hypothetical protein
MPKADYEAITVLATLIDSSFVSESLAAAQPLPKVNPLQRKHPSK